MLPQETTDLRRIQLRFTLWMALSALIIGVGLVTSHRTMAQSVICSGNSSIPIAPTLLTLTRTGAVTYEVSLCTTPSAPVQVGVLPDLTGKVIIAPAVLTFTTPVSQTVALAIDPSVPLTEAFTVLLHHTVASADPAYNWGATNTPSVIANYLVGSITGVVFDDRNGNFVHDTGEPPLVGAAVMLAGSGVTVTDAAGYYWFTGLAPGAHLVTLTPPAGYHSILPVARTVNVAVGVTAVVDYPMIEPGVIQGVVFDDVNSNGRQDAGEPGLAGVMVSRSDGPFATTGADGAYRFTGVAAGVYTLAAGVSPGYVASGARTRTISLAPGGAVLASFAFQTQGVIQGVVFDDRNGNGAQDIDEAGVGGATVTLDGGSAQITDAAGAYRFTGVVAGDYTVALVIPAGYTVNGDAARPVYVGGGSAAQANFALLTQGAIQGVVFDDSNGNGTQDASELGVAGVVITGTLGISTLTDDNGFYQYAGVVPGVYTIIMIVPNGYAATGLAEHVVYLGSGAAQANFSVQAMGTVQGVLYEDINGNARQDSDEPGLGGVPVTLEGVGVVTSTLSGGYRFDAVTPGVYTLSTATPSGFTPMQPTAQLVSLADQSAVLVSFGFRALGVIDGVVFLDKNGNGVLDNDEQGVAGVAIALVDVGLVQIAAPGAAITVTTATNAHGAYRFDLLPAGRYRLHASTPPGYVNLTAASAEVELTATHSGFANFPLQVANTIFGAVFVDLNGNDLRDSDEPGLAAAPIYLQGAAGMTTLTTTLRGEYIFTNVAAGAYTVTLGVLTDTGFLPIGPTVIHLSLPAGGSAAAFFTVLPYGAIVGHVDLSNTPVELSAIPTERVGAAVRTTRTNCRGDYWFLDVTPGAYEVRILLPLGFTAVKQIYAIDFVNGVARVDFDVLVDGVIQGVVFEDMDANRLRDVLEPGLGGQTVRLLSGGSILTETVTTATGRYRFEKLPAALYTLDADNTRFVQSEEIAVTLSITQPGANLDIGLGRLQAITGRAYLDTMSVRAIDAATVGLANMMVAITGPQGDTMLTDVRGFYRADLLPAGVYTVTASVPTGFLPTTPTTQNVLLSADVAGNGINFGVRLGQSPTPAAGVHLPLIIRGGGVSTYTSDFSQGAGSVWSQQLISTSPSGETFLGEFDNEVATLQLTDLPAHQRVTLIFDLYIIRSWDGNLMTYGPDYFQVRQNQQAILDATFSNWPQFTQHYPTISAPARTGAIAINTLGYQFDGIPQDTIYRISLPFAHSANFLTLDFAAAGLQGRDDESWGLNRVIVYLE